MKLNQWIRQAFVSAVMKDVPRVDYDEMAQKIIMDAVKSAFEKVFPGVDYAKACDSDWLEKTNVEMPGDLRNPYIHAPHYKFARNNQPLWAELCAIADKERAQRNQRDTLIERLEGIARACNTRKQLAEALPEFEKYLPPEAPNASRSLPVVANLVSDFVKAGWPKQENAK